MTWTLSKTLEIMPVLNETAKLYGLGIAIGGSVAFKGESDNDLDLVIFNLKSKPGDHLLFLSDICHNLNLTLRGVVDNTLFGDTKLVYKLKMADKRRVDLLFVNLTFEDRAENAKVLTRRKPKIYT